jgi:DNA recombination protein RmuC
VGSGELEPKHPVSSAQDAPVTTIVRMLCLMGLTVTSVVGGPWDGGVMNLMSLLLVLLVGLVLGTLVGVLWARSRPAYVEGLGQGMVDQAEVMQGLDRLSDQLQDFEHARATWQGQLHQQVLDMRHTADGLRRETQTLSTALRRPQVRGRWGELHLRRAVELAGLVDRCDFEEQVQLADGALRPDVVVRLAGGRSVVVDAKVPLDAFLDATATDDPDQRDAHLARHARQLRGHIELLGSKRYWRSLPETPEFVVLFLPAESFLAAGLDADASLIEHAADRGVVLASPTTLIALLRTVAHGWRHESLADRAREIHRVGRDLHERLRTMGTHLGKLGRSLDTAVGAYNQTVGSWESRVLVAARRFEELDATDDVLASPRQVETAVRAVGSVHPLPRRAADDDGVVAPTVGS